jgi:hypothetical protein
MRITVDPGRGVAEHAVGDPSGGGTWAAHNPYDLALRLRLAAGFHRSLPLPPLLDAWL